MKNMSLSRVAAFLVLSAFFIIVSGCDAGSDGPTSSGLSSGSGYRIELAASHSTLKAGATPTLTVVVFEPDGAPIRDGVDVFFSSSLKGSFSDDSIKTAGGIAAVTYTAAEAPWREDQVSATCQGAIATVKIAIVAENF